MQDSAEGAKWSQKELNEHRKIAEGNFVEQRMEQGVDDYLEVYDSKEPMIRRLFKQTDDLRNLTGDFFVRNPEFVTPVRHITAPPISQDDLNTIVGENIAKRKNIPRDAADDGVSVIKKLVDPTRFPWVLEDRPATDEEREKAIKATTTLWSVKRTQTNRRNDPANEQEQHVVETLKSIGLRKKNVSRIKSQETLDRLPPGCFAHKVEVRTSEADIAVRLDDGRLLAIEGKVSNSSVNSIKRLIHEVGDKATHWREEFGNKVVPAAVIAGVYDMKHLKEAQNDRDILLFWEHNLESLKSYVSNVE